MFCSSSDVVVRLLDGDPVLGQHRREVLHGEGVALVLALRLAAGLLGTPHLAVLEGVVGDVRDELLGRKGDQADEPSISSFKARGVEIVSRNSIRDRRVVVLQLQQEIGEWHSGGAVDLCPAAGPLLLLLLLLIHHADESLVVQ